MITTKAESTPHVSPYGEVVYELLSCKVSQTQNYSLAHIEILPGQASPLHYHPKIEESYYILAGRGEMILDGKSTKVGPGDCIGISPTVKHKIINLGDEALKLLVVCAPGWTPDCSVFLE